MLLLPKPTRQFVVTQCLLFCCAFSVCLAQEPAQPAEAVTQVLCFDFESPDNAAVSFTSDMLSSGAAKVVGSLEPAVAGPSAPEFPEMPADNRAWRFAGDGGRIVLDDPGEASPFDFTAGETISLTAWVQLDQIGPGANVYLIGKGRTGRAGFPADNQNWALRLRESGGSARVSFLFADDRVGTPHAGSHWHRWTSTLGFAPSAQWHHVALTYTFGAADSLRCWVNGVASTGAWDMGGATDRAPHQDDDQVWIASSMRGSHANSFAGALDQLTLYRGALDAADVTKAYRRSGGPPRELVGIERVPEVDFPAEQIQFTLFEGLASHAAWYPAHRPPSNAISTWNAEHFFLHRLPYRYDDWGVRESWQAPVLVRAAGEITLPAGSHRLLMRARGLSRLWFDGQVVARTKPHGGSTDGHQPVDPLPQPPLPGLRIVGYGDQEVFAELHIESGGTYPLIWEMIVGGAKLRPEPGESLLAVETADGQSFQLLGPAVSGREGFDPAGPLLTDVEIIAHRQQHEAELTELDDATRRRLAAQHTPFWKHRHALASQWIDQQQQVDPIVVPKVVGKEDQHPIDAFIANKIAQAHANVEAPREPTEEQFEQQVLPLLSERCLRCHGEKAKGGLRLDSLAAAMQGGDSGDPAVVPGDASTSSLILRLHAEGDEQMPPGKPLSATEQTLLTDWIDQGAAWPTHASTPTPTLVAELADDASFLRRVALDTLGVPLAADEVRKFLQDTDPDKRQRLIDRLLADPRLADHWVSYWQDVLAENPNPLKPSLNNSGPFRWFLYEQLRDGQPWDRMVTELIMLRGSEREGGSAGFGFAADNDVPQAAKAHVLTSAFLGIDMQCARCHDSPYSSPTQGELFSIASMLARKPLSVPATSTVGADFFAANQDRQSLISVTLPAGQAVEPAWPFSQLDGGTDPEILNQILRNPEDSRERLAARITSPLNPRFAEVLVNRVWQRLMGAGIVEPVHDWEGAQPSHPQLLRWLAVDFVRHGYDFRHLMRQIMNSEAYQREAVGNNREAAAEQRWFAAPDRRRLTAEQIVDSLFTASGTPLRTEELTFDPEARRPATTMISLGFPQRAWQFASLSNERDRPSLSLPRAQAVADVLSAFGWTGSRQNPIQRREQQANLLQPGILANGTVTTWVTRASVENELAAWALAAESPQQLSETLYLQFLGRLPSKHELEDVVNILAPGFAERQVPADQVQQPAAVPPLRRVSWSNHLAAAANEIQIQRGQRAQQGAASDPRLTPAWREAYEDVVWAVVNSPEFVWVP